MKMKQSRRGVFATLSAYMAAAGGGAAGLISEGNAARSSWERVDSRPHANVLEFGAVGNGIDDDSAAFQRAVDSLPAYGGRIVVPYSTAGYLIGDIACGLKAVEWAGEGGAGQSAALGHGATELIVKDDTVGIMFGDGKTNLFRGPLLKNLRLVANSSRSLGGLLFKAVSTASAYGVVCSNFSGPNSYGWKFDGGASSSRYPSTTMYNDLYGCGANNCRVGVLGYRATGLRIFGGLFDANDNHAGVIVPGSSGVLWERPGDTLAVFGTRFQSYEIHIDSSCAGTFVSGTRHEAFSTAIKISADFCTLMPGEMDNSLAGGQGIGIVLASGKQAFVVGNAITAVSKRIDRGTSTNYTIIDGGTFEAGFTDGAAGLLLAEDTNLYRPKGVPNVLRTDDQFRAGDGISTKVVSGSVADADFSAPPSDGLIAVDTVHNRLYVRVEGKWLFTSLQTADGT